MDLCEALCEICGNTFTLRKYLYRHLREVHKLSIDLNMGKVPCNICAKMFSSAAALNRHRKLHRPAPQQLSCTDCDVFTCRVRKELRSHLECEHGINMETKEMEFHSMEHFCGNMDSRKGLCEICGVVFTFRKGLYKHLRDIHKININLNMGKLPCNICKKMFSCAAALDRHKKTHRPAPQKLLCTECDVFTCRILKELRSHLESEHGIKMETKEMEFHSIEQFLQWKLKMETEERVSFVRKTGEKSHLYYVCHRSGTAVKSSLGKRLRAPSTKINKTCPAAVVATKMPSGKIVVKFYTTHTGHDFSAKSLRLTQADRAMIARQITAGVSEREILRKVRDNIHEGSFRRVHLLTRKDIYNIKKAYKLDNSVTQENDALSVYIWVPEVQEGAETVAMQPSPVTSTVNLQAVLQEKCAIFQKMMANISNENALFFIESLDKLMQQASVITSSQKENASQEITCLHFPVTK